MIKKIEDFQKRHKMRDRSMAIMQLVQSALYLESKMGLVETWTSQDLEDIREQMQTGELVDWIAKLDRSRFNAIVSIVRSEEETRNGQKKLQ